MTFFSKKNCDICGEKIGILGNKKVSDGNICKDCDNKLSYWFNDRRNTPLTEISEQLAYREANKEKVSDFNITRSFGSAPEVLIDDGSKQFMISYAASYERENPDVLNFSDVTNCIFDIVEIKQELKRLDEDGKEVRFKIRRYEYSYDFKITLNVAHPYIEEISYNLNSYSVDGNSRQEYETYQNLGEEICSVFNNKKIDQMNQDTSSNSEETFSFCPHCDKAVSQEDSKFCGSCGKVLE